MKQLITIMVVLLFTLNAWAVITPEFYPTYYLEDAGRALGGEHTTLKWSGVEYLPKNVVSEQTTDWIQYGYSPNATMAAGNVEFHANPEVFTLTVWLDSYPTNDPGDSTILSTIRFEYADSLTAVVPFWNADSSNLVVADGYYSHSQYGTWRYEDIPKTLGTTVDDKRWVYTLRVTRPGGCIRLVFGCTVDTMDDSTRVRYELSGEN